MVERCQFSINKSINGKLIIGSDTNSYGCETKVDRRDEKVRGNTNFIKGNEAYYLQTTQSYSSKIL